VANTGPIYPEVTGIDAIILSPNNVR
jgi:hypothetical protein